MARYKEYSYAQKVMLLVSFEEQILPGTFEHSLNEIIDHHLEFALFMRQ